MPSMATFTINKDPRFVSIYLPYIRIRHGLWYMMMIFFGIMGYNYLLWGYIYYIIIDHISPDHLGYMINYDDTILCILWLYYGIFPWSYGLYYMIMDIYHNISYGNYHDPMVVISYWYHGRHSFSARCSDHWTIPTSFDSSKLGMWLVELQGEMLWNVVLI